MLMRAPAAPNIVQRLCEGLLEAALQSYARHAPLFGAIILGLYIAATAAAALVRPDANWDMLAYLSVAHERVTGDPQQLHDFAYGSVKAAVSDAEFHALTDDGGGFRSHMFANAGDFISLLPMYRVKFFYAELLSTMGAVMSPVTAMRVLSAASVILFGAVALLWLRAAGALALGPLLAGVLMMTEFGDSARASTPDMLAAALMLAGLYAYMRMRSMAAAALLFFAFLVRPDNIIPLAVLAVMLVALRVRAPGVLAGFAASLAAYFAISAWAGHPGWWPHLYFSSIEQQLNMENFHPDFSLVAYLRAFARAMIFALWHNSWVGATLVAVATWFALDRAGYRLQRPAGVLFAALVLGLAAKFVAFPIHDTRVYYPSLAPLFMLLAAPAMSMWLAARQAGADSGK